jgi:hypothetical protein
MINLELIHLGAGKNIYKNTRDVGKYNKKNGKNKIKLST